MTQTGDNLISNKIPKHIAIIMDGNGRWANQKNKNRIFGHKNGVQSVREVVETAAELQVEYLTLYAFSTENWQRPAAEVNALMDLLATALNNEVSKLHKNNVVFKTIGNTEALPPKLQNKLQKAIELTRNNTGLKLIIALSYSFKWEMVEAVKKIVEKNTPLQDIDNQLITDNLSTANYPDPELLIRTGGEQRISNFLLWQLAYSELYFTKTYWPDFRKKEFIEAIKDFQKRERRFGKTSEQIKTSK